jgi:dihydrofolate reductase
MANLIYSVITSLDGYVADEDGNFDWSAPDEEVHTFVNDLERSTGTYLYGRRIYEVMVSWETFDAHSDQPAFLRDYTDIWRAADKIGVVQQRVDGLHQRLLHHTREGI